MGVRDRLGHELFARGAGDDGARRRVRIHGADGPRRFGPDDPIQRVHGDASMFVGGIRALLLQSLHPLAMAAVDQHSGFRGDPWGRLQRTSGFLAETTFGTVETSERAVRIVRAIHRRVRGTAPDGRPYAADDPHLLTWVHVAEVDSFLRAHDRYGGSPLSPDERDLYVAQAAEVARALGADDPPTDTAGLADRLHAFRPELASTAAAREAARFLLLTPPVPWALRPGYAALSGAAVGLLPRWARRPLRLPWLPVTETLAFRTAGSAATKTIRWAMQPGPPNAVSGGAGPG
ncbi:oxygenase MpaB family protein [Mumia sp.]|uniref:oxygenase MpaB family protein n=1 Tax=Mumia sp. TaxID=1965300 RepID=UPI002604E555|nr:oxygenase MpaB family protein [Mumia sp.]MDD9347731.1 oxygenase MpaB family protein [Mumia sp.]